MNRLFALWLSCCLCATIAHCAEKPANPRAIFVQAALSEDSDAQINLIKQLIGAGDELVSRALSAWRVGELYLYSAPDGTAKIPFILDAQQDSEGKAKGIKVADEQFIKGADGGPVMFLAGELTAVDNSSKLRKAIKVTLDLFAIGNPVPKMRRDAIIKLGQEQNPEYLPFFETRLKTETVPEVIKVLNEAIAITQTVNGDASIRNAAIKKLGEMRSINALAFLKDSEKKARTNPEKYGAETVKVLHTAMLQIEDHLWWGNLVG